MGWGMALFEPSACRSPIQMQMASDSPTIASKLGRKSTYPSPAANNYDGAQNRSARGSSHCKRDCRANGGAAHAGKNPPKAGNVSAERPAVGGIICGKPAIIETA